jgi:tRNA-specific 2-thiouridylase
VSRLRVLAAMSGGVDSAVAAALMAEQGHDVTGVTLKLACYGATAQSPRACCTLDAIDDARRTAMRMGFAHHVLDAEELFRERVLMPFANGYASGRTPYPCAACNQHLKFGDLVRRMEMVGADVLVTGHYARIAGDGAGEPALLRGVDRAKDQSYALALVPYAALARVRLPLGAFTKAEVRAHARRLGLSCWDKTESQDLCFVPDGDYAGYLTGTLGVTRGAEPGAFVDTDGHRLGTHRGILHYTVGQRRGLNLPGREPLYVLAIDADSNEVTVGPREQLESPGLVTAPMNWLAGRPLPEGARVLARIRYNHAGAFATVHAAAGGAVELRFEAPQAAIAPGQLAVLYDSNRCLGGAPIARSLAAARVPHAAMA